MNNLPAWELCEKRAVNGEASMLELFIYEYEPAGKEHSALFRALLYDLMKRTNHVVVWADDSGSSVKKYINCAKCGIKMFDEISYCSNCERQHG